MNRIKTLLGAFVFLLTIGASFAFTSANRTSQENDCWSSGVNQGNDEFDDNSARCTGIPQEPCCYKPGPGLLEYTPI